MSKLFLFATIRIKPEYFEQARAALDGLMPPTLAEAGCHVFSAFQSQDQDNTLHLFECFDDMDALNAHYAADYTKEVFTAYEEWLAAPVEVTKLSAISPTTTAQFGV